MRNVHLCIALVVACVAASLSLAAPAPQPQSFRLVPFPKRVTVDPGQFFLDRPLILRAGPGADPVVLAWLASELTRAKLPVARPGEPLDEPNTLRLAPADAPAGSAPALRESAGDEDYALAIEQGGVVVRGKTPAGLRHGVQTLCQLIRANRVGAALPCLSIQDWPSLRWRCFQDDLTRGPSSRYETLQRNIDLGAFFHLNLFTWYMEYQFAFKKHPLIGPPDGSLQPEELQRLVAYAKPRGLDVLGNQQSFGHFGWILRHAKYAPLRENSDVLSPVVEQTYQLLDDLYSEICPLVPFEMFNVCCDETWGLGTGPSKELAGKIGVGGVYVQHLRRVHDLLKNKYQKRMMMWGDIILQHPEHLKSIPADTVMLTWGYDAKESFEDQIIPFARSGYEFFICPGISNWSRILPDFAVATTNIRNFVRDGVKHGTIGMLNTSWEDDGEALKGYIWHGHAWGAECAWNASATDPADFNRRIGAVLFGEKGDHFGKAIELLSETHRLPGMKGMNNARFWEKDFTPRGNPAAIAESAGRLLALVRPAIAHLEACQREATVNADLLDAFLLGARRMERMGQRMLDGVECARLYEQARSSRAAAASTIEKIRAIVRANRDAHDQLGKQFSTLWLRESRPYALDWTMRRYALAVKNFDDLDQRLAAALKTVQSGGDFPDPADLGLAPPTLRTRQTPFRTEPAPLAPDAPWLDPQASHRLHLVMAPAPADRQDLPLDFDLPLPESLRSARIAAWAAVGGSQPRRIPAQFDRSTPPRPAHLTLILPGLLPKNQPATVSLYLGGPSNNQPLPSAVRAREGRAGSWWLENDKLRLMLGREGAHLYRWELKSLDNLDLTMPGETGWAGFSDLGGDARGRNNTIECLSAGPAAVRLRATDPSGAVKLITLYAGVSWVEVLTSEPAGYYWDFDNPRNFAADGPSPGRYRFSSGATGPLGREADAVAAQVRAADTRWAVKWNDRILLGMLTPDRPVHFHIGPGGMAGGVGIESSPPAAHFITVGATAEADPAPLMDRLLQSTSLDRPPQLTLHPLQSRPQVP